MSKKFITRFLSISLTTVCFLNQPVYAQGDNGNIILMQILSVTTNILNKINETPAYIEDITKMAMSWNETKDPNNVIGNNEYAVGMLNQNYNNEAKLQIPFSQELTNEFLLAGSFRPQTPQLPINANELSYSILTGEPLVPPATREEKANFQQKLDAYMKNYIKNLSGTPFILKQANPSWGTDSPAKKQYESYYNTLASIKSFNTYALSNLYKQQDKDKYMTYLVDQASNKDWYVQVASQPLGLVLRQILMYNSQMFVLFSRIAKMQQQQLAATTMTNTLLSIQIQESIGSVISQRALQESKQS